MWPRLKLLLQTACVATITFALAMVIDSLFGILPVAIGCMALGVAFWFAERADDRQDDDQ